MNNLIKLQDKDLEHCVGGLKKAHLPHRKPIKGAVRTSTAALSVA